MDAQEPVSPGTMTGPVMNQGAKAWQVSVNGMNSMMGAQSDMSGYQAEP